MEGQILGNRYELLEKIGGGGMAVVYKAKCRLLNRYVAIKILRPEFTNDDEFVKRFRVEAQSAASLSHPNIVPIYDVGNEGNIHYIVMEFVKGITLKEHIDRNGPLDWKDAVRIEIQICSAIEHAHQNHIIHRDIKPHNILLTKEGVVKVTDFGIARAVSSSTITMVGSTIGSVHYFSPEQARGGFVDEKSDLYSLGIVLYEMVTRRVPFDGDTPVAVALKHIQINPEEPIEINSTLPKGVNKIIMKAIKKEQNERYQKAEDLTKDLQSVLNEPDGSFVTDYANEDIPTRRIKAISEDSLTMMEGSANKNKSKNNIKKNDKLTYWLAGITAFILISIIVVIGYSIIMPTILGSNDEFSVGDYSGRNITEVENELAKSKISVDKNYVYSNKYDKDIIVSNEFKGQTIKQGNSIEIKVSKGKELYKLADYSTTDKQLAEKELTDSGLVVDEVQEFSDTVPKGSIIRTDPETGTEVEAGSTVKVFISKGVEIKKTLVPNLVGKTQNEAFALLRTANLFIGNVYPESSAGTLKIVKQEPTANTEVNMDSTVDIFFTEDSQQNVVNKDLQVQLTDPSAYGDTIKVKVVATPSDTGIQKVIIDKMKNKTEFPISVTLLVPKDGSTTYSIFLNDKPYKQNVVITPTD